MPARLADRLNAARRAVFVGRTAEKATFEAAIQAQAPPFCVLHIYGPGGIGKTTLLRELAALCPQYNVDAIVLDARNFEPAPDAFYGALASYLQLPEGTAPEATLKQIPPRCVLFVDTYELLAPLDNWLRDTLLPELPENVLVVLAGRNPPRREWQLDSAWQSLVRLMPLHNLSADESSTLLARRSVPPEQHRRVLDFTHGHPLALSLVADVFAQHQRDGVHFNPQDAPDVVRLLIDHLVQEVPDARHRLALEGMALVRCTTEPLLAHLLDLRPESDEASRLFAWLRSLSFVESGTLGLSPHEMAREAIMANLRWRNPEAYAELHHRARSYYAEQLKRATPHEQQRILVDYIFLHHDNSVIRPFLEWQESGDVFATAAQPADFPYLLQMVRQHEGETAAQVAAHWFEVQPHNVLVFRGASGIGGFMLSLALHETSETQREADSLAAACWNYMLGKAPLQNGQASTLFRFWMASETYQAVSGVQSLVFVNIVRHYLTTPQLAYSFLPCADPEFWTPVFTYAGATRFHELDFQIDQRAYGVYGHDWRLLPALDWLDMLGEREIAAAASERELALLAQATAATTSQPPTLSENEFAECVREALKNFHRPTLLANNCLLQTKIIRTVVDDDASAADQAAALQHLLRSTCEGLRGSGRNDLFARAVQLTYLEPALTQEAAADQMDVPFSTFRRYLKTGIERVTEQLWHLETQKKK